MEKQNEYNQLPHKYSEKVGTQDYEKQTYVTALSRNRNTITTNILKIRLPTLIQTLRLPAQLKYSHQ